MSVASMYRLRESALGVFYEVTVLSKAQRKRAREASIERLRKEFASIFAKQGRAYLERLPKLARLFAANEVKEAAYDQDIVDAFADVFGTTRKQAEKALFESMFDGITGGYAGIASDFGLETSFKLKPAQATKWARENAASRITKIDESTQTEIRDLISNSLRDGKSYGETAREIRDRFDGFTTQRAETVAITENAFAYENGQATLVKEIKAAGIDMEKAWSTIGGDECEICADNEAAGWIPSADTFPSGDENPPNHPNCRCSCIYRIAEGTE